MQVEVWSDIVCPWCYIGKRRLEAALSLLPRRDTVAVTWRSFQLDPSAPKVAEETTRAMLARKYGVTLGQADAMQARVTDLAAREGLTYRLDRTRQENSFDAHRLVHFAQTRGLQDAMQERLFQAYFTEGASIGDADTLIRLAEEAGLEEREAASALEGGLFADAVRADLARAAALGIRGVPFFLIGGRFGVSGAQPAETLREALEAAWKDETKS